MDDSQEKQTPEFSDQTNFLDMARWGNSQPWVYSVAITASMIFSVVAGLVIFIVYMIVVTGGMPSSEEEMDSVNTMILYLGCNLSILPILMTVLVSVKFIHKRPIMSLISPTGKIKWSRIFIGFAIYFVLSLLTIPLDFLLYPQDIRVTFDAAKFFACLPVVCLITPIQTTAEELFFRAWILQALSLATRNIWVLAIINGIIFSAPHMLNREVESNPLLLGLFYFGVGVMLSYITLKSNGLEYAIGVHASNNLFSLIYTSEKASLPVESILITKNLHPLSDLISFTIVAIIMCLIVNKLSKKEASSASAMKI